MTWTLGYGVSPASGKVSGRVLSFNKPTQVHESLVPVITVRRSLNFVLHMAKRAQILKVSVEMTRSVSLERC